jgi:hypothetical protein
MPDPSDEVVVVAAAPKARNGYFKWTDEMEELLVKAVMASKAYKKSKSVNETYEVKYNRVIVDLWSRKVFSDQGPKQAWTTVQAKFFIFGSQVTALIPFTNFSVPDEMIVSPLD